MLKCFVCGDTFDNGEPTTTMDLCEHCQEENNIGELDIDGKA